MTEALQKMVEAMAGDLERSARTLRTWAAERRAEQTWRSLYADCDPLPLPSADSARAMLAEILKETQ